MKPSAFRIERLLAKVEAEVERRWLRVIIDGDDEAEAKTKALAEHVARHPEDVGRTVEGLQLDTADDRQDQPPRFWNGSIPMRARCCAAP